MDHLKQWYMAHLAWISGVAVAAWPGMRHAICDNPKVSGVAIASAIFAAASAKSPFVAKGGTNNAT